MKSKTRRAAKRRGPSGIEVAGGKEAQRQGDQRGGHRAEEGHQDRLEDRPGHVAVAPHLVAPELAETM
jgi:hypothetical protein